LGALAVGGKGAITGMANVTPRVIAKAYELYEAGQHAEAVELAGLVSRSEWALGKGGILGTKVGTVMLTLYTARPTKRVCCLFLRHRLTDHVACDPMVQHVPLLSRARSQASASRPGVH
jgi:hypothetical protein